MHGRAQHPTQHVVDIDVHIVQQSLLIVIKSGICGQCPHEPSVLQKEWTSLVSDAEVLAVRHPAARQRPIRSIGDPDLIGTFLFVHC